MRQLVRLAERGTQTGESSPYPDSNPRRGGSCHEKSADGGSGLMGDGFCSTLKKMDAFAPAMPMEKPRSSKLPLYASGAAVIAVLWLILPGASLYYDVSPKAVALLVGLAALVLSYRDVRTDASRMLDSRAGRVAAGVLLCQFALMTLATVFSTSPALSLAGSNWRRMGWVTEGALLVFCFLLACLRTARPEAPLLYLRVLTFAGTPVAGYAILQFLHIDPFLDPVTYTNSWLHLIRPPATMGHPLNLANVLVPMLVAAAALVRLGSRPVERWCAFGTALLLFAAILLTDSRSALLALLGAAAVVALRPGSGRGFRLRVAALGAVLLLLAGFAAVSFGPRPLRMMYERWRTDPAGGIRLPMWRDSLRMAVEPRLFGTGPETFPVVFPAYWSHDLAVRYPNHYHESPHNIFLDIWLSRGALAGLAFMAMIGLAFARSWRAADSTALYLPPLLAAVVVAHLFSVFTIPDALIFYLILGLALGSPHHPNAVTAEVPTVAAWAAAGIGVFAVIGVVFAVQLLVAEHFLAATSSDLARRQTATALDHYAQVQTWQPPGACFDLWFARNVLARDEPDTNPAVTINAEAAVLNAARRAAQCSEQRHNALLLLATVYARRAYDQATEQALRRAIEQAPLWHEPHFHLSQLLLRLDRKEEARQEALRADDLSGGDARIRSYLIELMAPTEELRLPRFPALPVRP